MKTRRISIREALPGMVTAEDVYTYNNQLVISKGTVLSDKVITRLRFYSISHFHIFLSDATLKDTPVQKVTTQSKLIKESQEFKQFSQTFVTSVKEFKGNLNNVVTSTDEIDVDSLLEHTTSILSDARNGIHVFDMLHNLRSYDDITYVHSVNVSLICRVFGGWLKMSEKDIDVLTLCGLLHDVGKLTLPASIINKKEPLTDEEYNLVKTHSIRGYKILKDKDIDPRIKYTALMHHERCDGSGYPKGFKGSELNSFAKIVAIADVYDAMTSPRVYRSALCPFDAISMFETEGLQKYDPKFIMVFLEHIGQSYLGNRVKLNNGIEGEIIMLNKGALSKPVIKVGDKFIDLSKNHDLVIESII